MRLSLPSVAALLTLACANLPASALDPGRGSDELSVTPPNSYAYGLLERNEDVVEAMNYMPPELRAGIRARTNTTDVTPYLAKALQTGKAVHLAGGDFYISDKLTLRAGQRLFGDGVVQSRLIVTQNFNTRATSVIEFGGASVELTEVGLVFDQTGRTTRASLKQYPWALDIRVADRPRIGRVRMSGCWNGIRGDGNPGGLDFGLLELGCFNSNLLLDGLQDFAHINSLTCWPYEIAGLADQILSKIWQDKHTACATIGRVDGLDIKSLNTFTASVLFNANGTDGAARQIGAIQLDGDGAQLLFQAGTVQIDKLSSTKSAAQDQPSVTVTGGKFIVSNLRTWGTTASPDVFVGGGTLIALGGMLEQYNANFPAAAVASGTLSLKNMHLRPNVGAANRAASYVQQTGGTLIVQNSSAEAKGRLSGNLIEVGSDNSGNQISGNNFGGWGYVVPAGASAGDYGPNRVKPFLWTPKLTFQTPGTASMSYTARMGRYWYEAAGIAYEFQLSGSMNAYKSASGAAIVSGLPAFKVAAPSIAQPIALSDFAGATFPRGQMMVIGVLLDSVIGLRGIALGEGATALDATSFPASRSGISIVGRGFIPTL